MSDITLQDIGRREVRFPTSTVDTTVPEWWKTDAPQIVTFLKKYYENLDSDGNYGNLLQTLSTTRDIAQTRSTNLTLIEDELLLGENYLEGILDTRTGAELSNNYYRTKGTKYGIQRFFRAFFQEDPDIVYGKDLLFNIGETPIGTESGKYIMNDKVFQHWAILIKIGLSRADWIELYQLFAHPAGMFVGNEVQIVAVNDDLSFDVMPTSEEEEEVDPVFEGVAVMADAAAMDISRLYTDSSEVHRFDVYRSDIEAFIDSSGSADSNQFGTLLYIDNNYRHIADAMRYTSPTFDEDSDGIVGRMDFADAFVTMDRARHEVFDSASGLFRLSLQDQPTGTLSNGLPFPDVYHSDSAFGGVGVDSDDFPIRIDG